jgi:hypothetical protein
LKLFSEFSFFIKQHKEHYLNHINPLFPLLFLSIVNTCFYTLDFYLECFWLISILTSWSRIFLENSCNNQQAYNDLNQFSPRYNNRLSTPFHILWCVDVMNSHSVSQVMSWYQVIILGIRFVMPKLNWVQIGTILQLILPNKIFAFGNIFINLLRILLKLIRF